MTLSLNYRPRFICNLVTQWRDLHLPPLTLCHCVALTDDRVTTLYTQWWTTPSDIVARNSSAHAFLLSAHAHSSEILGRNFKQFETSVGRAR